MAPTPRRLRIQVTQEDIDKAVRSNSAQCVVSQAIARTVKGATNIDTDVQSIRFSVGDERRVYLCPYSVQGYVVGFDAGDPIRPFAFELRAPYVTPRRRMRPAAREALAAITPERNAVRRARTAVAKEASPAAIAELDAARATYREALALAGPVVNERVTHRASHTPTLFGPRGKRRSYGHRVLRVNQLEPET
jgi:hypothetical protein